jgi:uncharacterized protein
MKTHTMIAFLNELFANLIFQSVLYAFILVHALKFFLHYYRFRQWSIDPFFDTGGMPSGHTATTVALTTAIALDQGPSALFVASAIFTMIIMRDSYGVRKSVSDQADMLNALSSEMRIPKKVRIVLGHTPAQVAAGFILGVAIAGAVYYF